MTRAIYEWPEAIFSAMEPRGGYVYGLVREGVTAVQAAQYCLAIGANVVSYSQHGTRYVVKCTAVTQ